MSSSLLIDEPPLVVSPTLAKIVGLKKAVFLQQLHFLSERSVQIRRGPGGKMRRWVALSAKEWHDPEKGRLTFASVRTIERLWNELAESGLVLAKQFGKTRGDMRNFYCVDYTHLAKMAECHLAKVAESALPQNGGMASRQLDVFSTPPKCVDAHSANLAESSLEEGFVVVRQEEEQQEPVLPAREAEPPDPDQAEPAAAEEAAPTEDHPTPRMEAYQLLDERGVSRDVSLSLIRHYSDYEIQRQCAHLDWQMSQGMRIRNPGGRLAKMIRECWRLPPGARAAYQRRFGGEEAEALPASVLASTEMGKPQMEDDAFDLRLAQMPELERRALRLEAERRAREQNPAMDGYLLEAQIQIHMRRLVRQAAVDATAQP